jgi:WD40 repeat protein
MLLSPNIITILAKNFDMNTTAYVANHNLSKNLITSCYLNIEDIKAKMDYHNVTKKITGHTKAPLAMIQLTNRLIATGSADNNICIWDYKNFFNCLHTLVGHRFLVYSLVQSKHDGNLYSASEDCTIRIWEVNNNFNCLRIVKLKFICYNMTEVSLNRFATSSADSVLRIYDTTLEEPAAIEIRKHTQNVKAIILLSNGNILSHSHDGPIHLFDGKTYDFIKTVGTGYTGFVERDEKVYCYMHTGNIAYLDLKDDYKLNVLVEQTGMYLLNLRILKDGRLAYSATDKSLYIMKIKRNGKIDTDKTENLCSFTGFVLQLHDGRILISNDKIINVLE